MNWLAYLKWSLSALYITMCSHSLSFNFAKCGHISHCQCQKKTLGKLLIICMYHKFPVQKPPCEPNAQLQILSHPPDQTADGEELTP